MKKFLITFFDKTTLTIDDQLFEEKIIPAMKNKIQFFSIEEGIYATSSIARVEKIKEEKEVFLLSEKSENPVTKETIQKVKKQVEKLKT